MSTHAPPHTHDGEHHWHPPEETEARVRALESLLVEHGIVTTGDIDAMVDAFEHDVGPMNGARVVARAWTDPDFRERLLADGTSAIAEMGLTGLQTEHVVVVANSPEEHHLVVCTLCSCYPWTLLGIPPKWFKSEEYRSRAVMEPRAVLRDFGVELAENTAVHVWDTSAEVRYVVVPERPAGTEGWDVEQLASCVTRDSMVGVGRASAPAHLGGG